MHPDFFSRTIPKCCDSLLKRWLHKCRFFLPTPLGCIDCHDIEDEDEGSAPDLTGYGSRDWLTAIVGDPSHERFYGTDNDRMPSFARDEKLTDEEIGILVDWLRSKPSTNSEVR